MSLVKELRERAIYEHKLGNAWTANLLDRAAARIEADAEALKGCAAELQSAVSRLQAEDGNP